MGSATAATSPGRPSASTGWSERCCRASLPGAWRRSRVSPWRTSSDWRTCTGGRGRPSSAWARGCRAAPRAARPSAWSRSCRAWSAVTSAKPAGPAQTRLVNHSRLGEALLALTDPPIRALFVAANNPAVSCPDAGAVRRGLSREGVFTVGPDPFLRDTARYADIVLPAATYLESEDVVRSYGPYSLQFLPVVIEPQGEAWSNRRLAQELARRLDLADPLFSLGTQGLLGALCPGAPGAA